MKNLLLVPFVVLSLNANAQVFGNMPFTTAQTTNPALIALPELPRLNVFGSFESNFKSSYIGYSRYSKKLKGSVGINYNGILRDTDLPIDNRLGTIGVNYAKLFNLGNKWKYSLGVGMDFAGSGWVYNGASESDFNLAGNIGGMLYSNRFFTGVNFGVNLSGRYQYGIRAGYKFVPFQDKNFSITPILALVKPFGQGGGPSFEANLNLSYHKMHLSLGYNHGGVNVGIGYDFKRFRLNYNVGNNLLINPKVLNHQFGIQFKLSKKHQPRQTDFNHRLF